MHGTSLLKEVMLTHIYISVSLPNVQFLQDNFTIIYIDVRIGSTPFAIAAKDMLCLHHSGLYLTYILNI